MKTARPFAALLLAAVMLLIPGAAQAAPKTHPVVVRVLASGGWKALPVVGARLTVREGDEVVARGRSGSLGMAILRARRGKGTLHVTARGGKVGGRRFGGTLSAEVRRYSWPETIHVDSVTTLASRYHRANPHLSASKAGSRTKHFLELPAGYVLGRDGTSNAAFDGRRFLATAGSGRRYDRFVGRLVRRIGKPKAHRSFAFVAPQRPHVGGGAVAQSVVEDGSELEQVTKDISAGEGFFSALEKGNQVLDFVHVALQLAGVQSSQASAAEVQEISSQLQQVEQSIGVVQVAEEELRNITISGQYSQAVREGREARLATVSAEDTLHSAAELALQEGCVPEPQPVTQACEGVQQMLVGVDGFSDRLREANFNTPSEVNSLAELIGGSALPKTPEHEQGIIQLGSELTSFGANQVFFTAEDSEDLQAIAAYWTAIYAEAVVVVPINWALEGAGADTVQADVEQLQEFSTAFPKLMPSAVPAGTVVDMKHGWMWPTEATGGGTWTPWSTLVGANPWRMAGHAWVSEANPELSLWSRIAEEAPELPFENWAIAGTAQINPLLEGVTTKAGQLPGEAVVEQAGLSRGSITPWYQGAADGGLEMEYQDAASGNTSFCREPTRTNCYWPILANDEVIVTSFHDVTPTYYYVQGTFKTEKFLDLKWAGLPLYGFNNAHTIFGSAPIEAIPVMLYRGIGPNECYFYPAPKQATGGSPGCA